MKHLLRLLRSPLLWLVLVTSHTSLVTGQPAPVLADPTTGALFRPSGNFTSLNSITSTAGTNLTLGTGTFGTALTFTSATGAATFAATISLGINQGIFLNSVKSLYNDGTGHWAGGYIDGPSQAQSSFQVVGTFIANAAIFGSGGSAPTSTTTGSNIFTAGIATSGPGYFGSSGIFLNATGQIVTSSSTAIKIVSSVTNTAGVNVDGAGSGTGDRVYAALGDLTLAANGSGKNIYLTTTGAGGVTTSGNLTVSGTGTSSFAGAATVAKALVTTPSALTYAAPTSVDVTLASCFTVTTVNATGSVTFNATAGGTAGQEITILITNDATSAKTITFGTNFLSTGTLTASAASRHTSITFKSDGTNWYETGRAVMTN